MTLQEMAAQWTILARDGGGGHASDVLALLATLQHVAAVGDRRIAELEDELAKHNNTSNEEEYHA